MILVMGSVIVVMGSVTGVLDCNCGDGFYDWGSGL